jgi:hypothetical protein
MRLTCLSCLCAGGAFWNLCHHFQASVAALPDFFQNRTGKNDASAGSVAGMLFGVSVHEEAAAAVRVGGRFGIEFQYLRAMIFAVDGTPGDRRVATRDGEEPYLFPGPQDIDFTLVTCKTY